MSHLSPGLIAAYNSLTDKHLAGYFNNNTVRRHLQRAGLITRSGRIVPDKEYRHKLIQRAHQRHVRECLAHAIFHKVLEMERLHQLEIKRKLEEFARRERVNKIKVERSKRYDDDIIRILSPRPPNGTRGSLKQHSGPEVEQSESSDTPTSSRPHTAPCKVQRPVRLKPLHGANVSATVLQSSPHQLRASSNKRSQPRHSTTDAESRRQSNLMEASSDTSPYCLPVINNYVTPVPPAMRRKETGPRISLSSTVRGRRLLYNTTPSNEPRILRSTVYQSGVDMNMIYYGHLVRCAHNFPNLRDDIQVFQQHCGGENVCVFMGTLSAGEMFQFMSKRHRGFPFSLTFFVNGLPTSRLSSCCEFKYRKGVRIGGRRGFFGVCSVEGASPCYKCIIALGLDNKPSPPPKRVKENGGSKESLDSQKKTPETERMGENRGPYPKCETSQLQVKDETSHEEDKVKDDYEEDFEADDDEKTPEKKPEEQVERKYASETEDEDIKSQSGLCSEEESNVCGTDREETDDEKTEKLGEAEQEESVAASHKQDEPSPEHAAAAVVESDVLKNSNVQHSAKDTAGDTDPIETVKESKENAFSGNENIQIAVGESKEEKEEEAQEVEEEERAKSVQEKLAEAIMKESQCSSEPELSDTSTEESVDECTKQNSEDAVPEKLDTTEERQQTIIEETKCEEEEEKAAPEDQKDQSVQELHEDSNSTKDEEAIEEQEKPAGDEEQNKSECTENTGDGLLSVKEENVTQDDPTSDSLEEEAPAKSDGVSVGNNEVKEDQAAIETNVQHNEPGQSSGSKEGEDESSVSEPNKKSDETSAGSAEAEAMTTGETMEMKAESSEEPKALGCEEAPVTDAETTPQVGSEDKMAETSETDVTAETSSSSAGDSGNTTVEKTEENKKDDASEKNKDEENKDDIKEESEVMAETVTSKDDGRQEEEVEVEEKKREMTVEIDEKVEEPKSEEEKQSQQNLHETAEEKNTEKEQEKEEVKEGNESNTDGRGDKEQDIAEKTGNDSNSDVKDNNEAEKSPSEPDQVGKGEKTEEPERKEEERESECVENKDEKENSEAKETNENKEDNEASQGIAGVEVKSDKSEKSERDEKESNAEQAKVTDNKDDENCQEKTDATDKTVREEGGTPEMKEDTDKGRLEESCVETVESEEVGERETTEGTKITEGTSINMTEAENVKGEVERASITGEKGEIDAENGELSAGAESNTQENEDEVSPADHRDSEEAAECGEEERKKEEPNEEDSGEDREAPEKSGDTAEKEDDSKAEQAPPGEEMEGDSEEDNGKGKELDQSPHEVSERETSGSETKGNSNEIIQEDPKPEDSQESRESNNERENKDSYSTEKNNNINEVIVVSSKEREESSATISVDLDGATHQSNENKESGKNFETETDEHVDGHVVGLDVAAAEDNRADTEEASKASEEGVSVLLKPRAQNSEDDEAARSEPISKGPPEVLAPADNTDLVTNWVNMHQSSKFFETFVEPLEDLTEILDDPVPESNKDETLPTTAAAAEPLRLVVPAEVARTNHDEEKASKMSNEDESKEKMKMEVVESDVESIEVEDKPNKSQSAEDPQQEVETTEVKDLLKAESEQSERESVAMQQEAFTGSRLSPEEEQDEPTQGASEEKTFSKTEVETIPGTFLSAASQKPGSVSENQPEENNTSNGSNLTVSQEVTKEMETALQPSEGRHSPKSPDVLKDTDQTQERKDELNREVTEITDLTTSKCDDGSQEESGGGDVEAEVSKERRELIQDIKHTLSKDRLSTFSVDETLFGRGSYSVLATARTESGH